MSVTEVVRCKLPLVAVVVNGNVPLALPAVTVNVVLPEVFTDVGLKLAVMPAANPLMAKVTVLLKPPDGVTVIV